MNHTYLFIHVGNWAFLFMFVWSRNPGYTFDFQRLLEDTSRSFCWHKFLAKISLCLKLFQKMADTETLRESVNGKLLEYGNDI